jgi:DNA-binding transcriptional ArsR family regulator
MKRYSRFVHQASPGRFAFLTNHAQVLLCIAGDPGLRLREIGAHVGITERAAHRIVGELEDAGYVTRRREGRRNRYTIEPYLRLPDPLVREQQVIDLLAIVGGSGTAARGSDPRREQDD